MQNSTNNFKAYLENFEKDVLNLKKLDQENTKFDPETNEVIERSNELASMLRKELILRSIKQTHSVSNGTIYFSTKAYHIIANTLIMFTDNANPQYPTLLKALQITFSGNCWKAVYAINEAAVSDRYLRYLAVEYPSIDIPTPAKEDRLKEIDNSILERLNCVDELSMIEAGIIPAI